MKERPMLFSGPMVRAILAGQKTQTRRVLKTPFPPLGTTVAPKPHELESGHYGFFNEFGDECRCPYGRPGGRLWLRETWSQYPSGKFFYRADGYDVAAPEGVNRLPWRPSIHMPRAASRITLQITDVRVERLQQISDEDAIAEGIERVGGLYSCNPYRNYRKGQPGEMNLHCSAPSRSFMTLWESIYGPGSWAENPWVWVIDFGKTGGKNENYHQRQS